MARAICAWWNIFTTRRRNLGRPSHGNFASILPPIRHRFDPANLSNERSSNRNKRKWWGQKCVRDACRVPPMLPFTWEYICKAGEGEEGRRRCNQGDMCSRWSNHFLPRRSDKFPSRSIPRYRRFFSFSLPFLLSPSLTHLAFLLLFPPLRPLLSNAVSSFNLLSFTPCRSRSRSSSITARKRAIIGRV